MIVTHFYLCIVYAVVWSRAVFSLYFLLLLFSLLFTVVNTVNNNHLPSSLNLSALLGLAPGMHTSHTHRAVIHCYFSHPLDTVLSSLTMLLSGGVLDSHPHHCHLPAVRSLQHAISCSHCSTELGHTLVKLIRGNRSSLFH